MIREGRFTEAQKRAFQTHWPSYGIDILSSQQVINLSDYFSQSQPIVLDVGFGAGDSLISLAQQRPDYNFVGIEVYRPGIGVVLQKIALLEIDNIRVINTDVQDFLTYNLATNSLSGMMVWFPDPWPKQKHSKRRLVQKQFLLAAAQTLKPQAVLHLASDWQPYVKFIRKQIGLLPDLFLPLSDLHSPLGLQRPNTRFEQRGLRSGHTVSDLFYQIIKTD